MSWKLPRIHGTDQGNPFDRMTPEQKATEFDASHADPTAYAERNFAGSETTQKADRLSRIEQRETEREARREEIIAESQNPTQKGRHRK
jgi:hypothetical protein